MTVAYIEMIGGASGNMLLGAFCDAGADLAAIERALRTIPVDGWEIEQRRVVKRGIAANYIDFAIPGEDHAPAGDHAPHGHGRRLADVLAIVDRSGLTVRQKSRAAAIYRRLGAAEARVHGSSVDEIHFHEVGAVDAILDVAASCIALDLLCVEQLFCSAFPIGRGTIAMSHGRYPNPPPATAELLRGAPTCDGEIDGEMVTTTGAAILTTLVERPGLRPPMTASAIGYGAGRSEFAIPNVARVSIGELLEPSAPDEVVVLEANLDDMSPQYFELAVERLFAAGALDVWLTPMTMKKGRPAIVLAAMAPLDREAACARTMLAETSTIGVRVRRERRYLLERTVEAVATPLGQVRVKTAVIDGRARRTLEYDDVVRIARERGRPIAEIAAELDGVLEL